MWSAKCPKCGAKILLEDANAKVVQCASCGAQVSVNINVNYNYSKSEHTEHIVDDAKIKQAQNVDRVINLFASPIEERRAKKKAEEERIQREAEEANMAKKNEIIAALEALLTNPGENVQQQVRDLQAQWNETGHVPFRKKEKMYKRYHEACDKVYKELHLSAGRRNLESFRKNVAEKGGNELTRERARLNNALEAKKQEIKNYETNLSFFSMKSKGANALVGEVSKKIERLKEDLKLIEEKIKAVNEKIKAEK